MRVDVTEGCATARRLVTLVRRFIDGEPVDDCRQLSAALALRSLHCAAVARPRSTNMVRRDQRGA